MDAEARQQLLGEAAYGMGDADKRALGFLCVYLRVSAAGFGFKRPLQTQNGRRWTQMHADNAPDFDSAPERSDSGKADAGRIVSHSRKKAVRDSETQHYRFSPGISVRIW